MRRPRFVGLRIVLFAIAWVAVMGLIVFGLWNLLAPAILHLPAISFWQALGLLILARVLFGRFGGWGGHWRKARFVGGWRDLTPDERERFRRAMGGPEGTPVG
jgi:hypothetical protein